MSSNQILILVISIAFASCFYYYFKCRSGGKGMTMNNGYFLPENAYQHSFQSLLRYYDAQKFPTYCGVASMVMVLNILIAEESKPLLDFHPGVRAFTQDNVLSADALQRAGIDIKTIRKRGITLEELSKLLTSFAVEVEVFFAEDQTEKDFKHTMKLALKDATAVVIANYNRSSLSQDGGGHYSPVAAYDPKKRLVLLMETSRHQYAPQWVKMRRLLSAMRTNDSLSGRSRGFIVVKKPVS
jgi:hypothetical protein